MNESVAQVLHELGEKLGKSVDVLWPQAVRYVAIEAAPNVIAGLLLILVTTWLARKFWRRADALDDSTDGALAKSFIAIATVVFCTLGFIETVSAIPAVFSPEGALITAALRAHGGSK